MAEPQYFTDFKFGSKSLSDFGGIIVNSDGWNIKSGVTSTKTTDKIVGKHGEILIRETFNPRMINVSILLQEDIDLDEFYGWLLSGQQTFSYEDSGTEIQATLDNEIDIRAFYNKTFKGRLDLTFIAYDPFWTFTKEKHITNNTVVLNIPITIKTKGNYECYPLIKITPNGTQSKIRFKWNGNIIALSNVTKDIYIDCNIEETYEINLGQKVQVDDKYFSDEYYSYPICKPYSKNTFELIEGSITNLDIQLNSHNI